MKKSMGVINICVLVIALTIVTLTFFRGGVREH